VSPNKIVEKVVFAFSALIAISALRPLKIAKSGFFYNLNAADEPRGPPNKNFDNDPSPHLLDWIDTH